MLPNFELRFVNRVVSGRQMSDGSYEATNVKILRYRTRSALGSWLGWKDVPVEDE